MKTRVVALSICILLLSLAGRAAAEGGYMGVNLDVSEKPKGILIASVVDDSPAAQAGLMAGDIVTAVDMINLADKDILATFREMIAKKNPGDSVELAVQRKRQTKTLFVNNEPVVTDDPDAAYEKALAEAKSGDSVILKVSFEDINMLITVTLAKRGGSEPPLRPNAELMMHNWLTEGKEPSIYKKLVDAILDVSGTKPQYDDLMKRLAATHEAPDFFRRQLMAYVHRDPFALETVTRHFAERIGTLGDGAPDTMQSGLYNAAAMLDVQLRLPERPPLKTGITPKEHIEQITDILSAAENYRKEAFKNLTEAELDFIAENRHNLTDAFVEHIYLHIDANKARFAANSRVIELAKKVDYKSLFVSAQILARLGEKQYLTALKADLFKTYAEKLASPVIETFPTPFGPIIIGGTTRNWYANYAVAVIIDLGGDDFYSNNSGSGSYHKPVYEKDKDGKDVLTRPLALPLGVILELGGNDAYESTRRWEIGSGSLGCGLLVDIEGDDSYVSRQWGQASAFLGVGMLIDTAGNDMYRGLEFCQGAAIFGAAIHLDSTGNDRYDGHQYCQAFAGAGAVAILSDCAGDDSYYAKGTTPTNYGDPGIFDAWSQGTAMGFRSIASGGIAALVDRSGRDRYEAGNFSQGGGYYFGYGMLVDLGTDDDYYIGSRYNQGFSAHEAVGAFIDTGGNDYYTTRQGVAQGLAWDECVTLLIDDSGNDTYNGGTGFSLCATAHNSICIFHDRGGDDIYNYPSGPARAGGNDYHGGTSFSLFLDTAGNDSYNAKGVTNNHTRIVKEWGIYIDQDMPIEKLVETQAWIADMEIESVMK